MGSKSSSPRFGKWLKDLVKSFDTLVMPKSTISIVLEMRLPESSGEPREPTELGFFLLLILLLLFLFLVLRLPPRILLFVVLPARASLS
jgi:hypothetical protein